MIHLRTLGGLDLKGPDARHTRAVLVQPKRVALLAYLALARPRGYQRRDALIALFWPDKDSEHARNALRQSIFALRQSLGTDIIDSRGDHDVGINWHAFSCDAEAFESALDAGRSIDALELYRGDLLPGFFVGGVDLEHWIESERARLRRLAAKEAWLLSDRAGASGNLALAVQWARHVAALSPDDEASVKRLVELLGKAGDRTEVARVYASFRKRLFEEYQMEPSSDLEAAVARIVNSRDTDLTSAWTTATSHRMSVARKDGAQQH
ncbi:MAG TPA: bacterial transcriptional activator domain-containing protein [Gemmatimonadaceae bacterium]|nr:bacterial transcriptional activator domain-containing protein [Gemmatimonadaceae bacterium]